MANAVKQLLNNIIGKLKHHKQLNNTNMSLRYAADTAQKKLIKVQNIASNAYNDILKQGQKSLTEVSQKSQIDQALPKKLQTYMNWYMKLIGQDLVEESRLRVDYIQKKLFECQHNRRSYNQEISLINDKLKCVYGELIRTNREDQKFVQLTMIENETLRKQTSILQQLKLVENEEKEYFTQLAIAIKEYQERQGESAQKLKYFSIIASVIVAMSSVLFYIMKLRHERKIMSSVQENSEHIIMDKFNSVKRTLNNEFADLKRQLTSQQELLTRTVPQNTKKVQEDPQGILQTTWNTLKSPYIYGPAIVILLKFFGI